MQILCFYLRAIYIMYIYVCMYSYRYVYILMQFYVNRFN